MKRVNLKDIMKYMGPEGERCAYDEKAWKLQDIIDEVQGKLGITSYLSVWELIAAVWEIDKWIKDREITKKNFYGTIVRVDVNAQDFPKSYKYRPETTHFDVMLTTSGWQLINVFRDYCEKPKDKFKILNLQPGTEAELIENAKRLV